MLTGFYVGTFTQRAHQGSQRLSARTLADGVPNTETETIAEDNQQLVKFHGMYVQDGRDLRPERTRKKLEKALSFMVRLRIPGGVVTPAMVAARRDLARLRQRHLLPRTQAYREIWLAFRPDLDERDGAE